MHELGIVKHIAATVCQVAEENRAEQVASVTVEAGEVSGIVPYYLIDCWNYFRERTPALRQAELKLETLSAVTWCDDCGQTYETVRYGRTCPHCGSEKTWLVSGNEFRIKEIAVVDPETDAVS